MMIGLLIAAACGLSTQNETAVWQAEIDRVSASGGGIVRLTEGRHRVGGLQLKSNVTLEIPAGSVLEGSTNIAEYADIHLKYAEVPEPWQALVWAEDQTNIAVVGRGTIDGNGLGFGQWIRVGRPRGMLFHRCRNVRVEDITMRSLASWTCYYKECDTVVHRNVKVYSHANWNTDGVDIEAKNVLVENCRFDTGDDGIVLKSDNPFFSVEDVVVRNCDIGTSCNVFKIGTASHGAFRRIRFENVRGHSATGELPLEKDRILADEWRREGWPGLESEKDPLGGIVVECVDGAHLEDVSFKDIDLGRVNVPIFIRAGLRRGRTAFGKPLEIPFGTGLTLKNVRIENVKAYGASWTCSSITGVPGLRVDGVTLKNVEISVPGSGEAGAKDMALGPVPEAVDKYPESNMFDNRILPAYGFFIRHADNVRFENVRCTVRGREVRPELVTEDVNGFVREDSGEEPYGFRRRLETVHEPGLADGALKPAADEFVFTDGVTSGDDDFDDYLRVSMGVKTGSRRIVDARIDDTLAEREHRIEVSGTGVKIRAKDGRQLHQALYHLEDLMNLRRAPFLKFGVERRRMRFSPRMIHSGYACDVFPDNYLKLIAHHGFDAIVFYIKDVDRTAAGPGQDVNGLIARAKRAGLDTYLYSSVSCFAHPEEPDGAKKIEDCFGRVAKAHPGAKGIVFVGESCQFPSRDPRVQPVRHQDKNHDDPRPLAGWFPCRDYPDWLRAVMDALHRYSPGMEIVFWTYNWSRQDAKLCAELIPHFPDGVSIQGTLGNGAVTKHDNGLVCTCRDYTVSTPGFTDHYAAQAKAAKAGGRRFYTMANTAGLTWDYGTAPYLPCPDQWKKRWDGLVDPQYGIAGLMETHHFGWYPSFISELAKEAYTEGGLEYEEHIRKIAARDFGERNAEKVLEAWRKWSRTEVDYVANNENQYGPFRIGPAFPYNLGGRKILHADFPQDRKAYHTMRWMAILNFPFDLEQAREQNIAFTPIDDDYRLKQLELFERMRRDFAEGLETLRAAAAGLKGCRRAKAEEMIGVGEWHMRTVETAINLNRGYLAFEKGDRKGVLEHARSEYANAQAALKLAERYSRLGWEPSMEYAAGPVQIRWKLGLMEKLYGKENLK